MTFKDFYEGEERRKQGTYVAVKPNLQSSERLYEWAEDNKIPNLTDPTKYHITVLYSRKSVPENKQPNKNVSWLLKPKGFDVFDDKQNNKKCLVLLISCNELTIAHDALIDAGGTHDYPDFKPHLTISYDISSDFDIKKLKVPNFELVAKSINSEPLDLNWKDNL